MTNATLVKTKNRTKSVAQEATTTKISTGAVAVFGTISTLVGLWAVACFVGALVVTGGPLALTQAWISAVTGG
jgi:hypothetical protein